MPSDSTETTIVRNRVWLRLGEMLPGSADEGPGVPVTGSSVSLTTITPRHLTPTEECRFEEWYAADSMPCEADWFRKDADGDYEDRFVAQAWRGWAAAREPLAAEIDRLRAEVARLRRLLDIASRELPIHGYAWHAIRDRSETSVAPGSMG